MVRRDWVESERIQRRKERIRDAMQSLTRSSGAADTGRPRLVAEVYSADDARAAAEAGADEVVFDPFLRRTPMPPVSRCVRWPTN